MDAYDIYHDAEDIEAFRRFDNVFKLRPLGAESKKEVAMSNTIKGKVAEVKVNPANGRHAYRIDGQWYSTFVNEKTSEEAAKVLGEIQAGYDVELAFTENKGFFNIDGVVSYAAGEPGEEPKAGPKSTYKSDGKKPWGGGGGAKGTWKPEDKRPSIVSFAVSYSKDMMAKLLDGADMESQSPEARQKFVQDNWMPMADEVLAFMLKKLKELDYKFPKAE